MFYHGGTALFNRDIKKRALLFAVCLAFALAPGALAESSGSSIDLTDNLANESGEGWSYDATTQVFTIANGANVTISGSILDGTRIVVANGATAVITLSGVNIDLRPSRCAFDMTGATVTLTLIGDNTLISGQNMAGLQVPSGAELTINGPGNLEAYGGSNGAGIGGGVNSAGGSITINGGDIKATGGSDGAGIGGGGDGEGGTIKITGGTVEANGTGNGAGIGGGRSDSGGDIEISGGHVTAKGDSNNVSGGGGAGVGGGGGDGPAPAGASGDISITGSAYVTATGGKGVVFGGGGAGIGGGGGNESDTGGAVESIRIDNLSNVQATGGAGGYPGAAIGTGGGGARGNFPAVDWVPPAPAQQDAPVKPKKDAPPPIVAVLYDVQKTGDAFSFKTIIANASSSLPGATVTVKLNDSYSATVTIGADGIGRGAIEAPGYSWNIANFYTRPNVQGAAGAASAYDIYTTGECVRR